MGRVSIDKEVLVECFPYMEDYYNLPRKKKKAMKGMVTKEIKKAILFYINKEIALCGKLDLTK
tara:strand:- start:4145 stop:4333 length:189 start_codon:yes stop_codon:yes gene_type:complete